MFRSARTPLVFVLIVLAVSLLTGFAARVESQMPRAVKQFRARNYSDCFALASKSPDSPQRSFLMGVSALRAGRDEEALPLLAEAEQKLPLVADYAALYQVEALLRLKRNVEAANKAASITSAYPGSLLVRRANKLYLDAFFAAGDHKGGVKVVQNFVEKYPTGSDSVDALFMSAQGREALGDRDGAVQIYRSIWINNSLNRQARLAEERLRDLARQGVRVPPYDAEELLRRASSQYSQNEFEASLQTLRMIPLEHQPQAIISRVEFRTGLALYRTRNWKAAEKSFARAAAGGATAVRSEARFWQAKSLERMKLNDRAFSQYMALVAEGKKQNYADDALIESAGMRKNMGHYREAARLFDQIPAISQDSRFLARSAWEAAWCHYLAGEYAVATPAFKALLTDDNLREKALYWLGRSLENNGNSESSAYFSRLLAEYPDGFYATWYREQKGIADTREALDQNLLKGEPSYPAGLEKPRMLASLGLMEEARNETAAIRKKLNGKKGQLYGLAHFYQELGEYGQAISLFNQNRPQKSEGSLLPFWSAGYPLVYGNYISRYAAANSLSEGLIYSLIRAESSFSPAVKSPVGAIGLMQLMPATARATVRDKEGFKASRLVEPEYNIVIGTRHFRDLLNSFNGDLVYSIAAYNAGSAAVERWKRGGRGLKKDEFIENIPYQETRDYVKKVYSAAATYRRLYGVR